MKNLRTILGAVDVVLAAISPQFSCPTANGGTVTLRADESCREGDCIPVMLSNDPSEFGVRHTDSFC